MFFSQKYIIFALDFEIVQKYRPNIFGYYPNEMDYALVFMPDDGIWSELGHDIPKYINIELAQYLSEIDLVVPDYCQFCRVIRAKEWIEYKCYDDYKVVISYHHKDAPIYSKRTYTK